VYQTIFETSNTSINADFVKQGFGISFILSFHKYRTKHCKDIAFIPMKDIFPDENISIGMRKKSMISATKQTFLNFILENPVRENILLDPLC
jgi:DNA-binding transcriptional LysR family regulator